MVLDSFFQDIKRIMQPAGNQEWFETQLAEIERHIEEDKNLPFFVHDIRENGFLVKVFGLYAYVSFRYMPWKYTSAEQWHAVFQAIKGKVFFGKIFKLAKDPLSIQINAEIPQFRKFEIFENEEYKGIVVKKLKYGLFVDLGAHFEWKSGSLVGILHKSQFDTIEAFDAIELGQEIEIVYNGQDPRGNHLLGFDIEQTNWTPDDVEKLAGKIVTARFMHNENEIFEFLVEDKYPAIMHVNKYLYPGFHQQVRRTAQQLKPKQEINAEVLGIDLNDRLVVLKWLPNSLNIDTETTELNTVVSSKLLDKLLVSNTEPKDYTDF
ncbi:MAG TPA: hypothetical protein DCQ31_15015 [Bacteroidales bacterium]|nr:hypothetical protein [Bacteroidales bacterium]